MKRLNLYLIITGLFLFLLKQTVAGNNIPYKNGEKLNFTGAIYSNSLWTDFAALTLETMEVTGQQVPVTLIQMTATTFASWDKFFKIRDFYQSWIETATQKPLVFKQNMQEGPYIKNIKYIFKRKLGTAEITSIDENSTPYIHQTAVTNDTYDLLSAFYYIRGIDFSSQKVNTSTTTKILYDSQITEVIITYKGIESIKTNSMGLKKCYKISISLKDNPVKEIAGANIVWVTADQNRVPVLIKADIPVGSVQLRLNTATGLKQ